MSGAELIPITFDGRDIGESLRLAWDRSAARSLAGAEPPAIAQSPWRVEREIDWRAIEAIRLVSAVFEDGRALALAALRPRGAEGHDRDATACRLEKSGESVGSVEALLSTEYDSNGMPRRIGIELWAEADSPPTRLAGSRQGEVELGGDALRSELARMSYRLEGSGGVGTYELLLPG